MLNKVVKKMTDSFIENKIITPENRVIYEYGLRQGFVLLFNIETILLIGIISGNLVITLFFMLAYAPLRMYAGGCHAPDPVSCYFISVAIVIGTIILVKRVGQLSFFWVIIFSLFIYAMAPVEAVNRKLGQAQKKAYKKTTGIILGGLGMLCLFHQSIHIMYLNETIIVAEMLVCFTEIWGYFQNRRVAVAK